MIRSATLIQFPGNLPGGAGGWIGLYMWFNIFLFSFLAVVGLGISYLMLRSRKRWRTTIIAWSLVVFFPIYFGVFYELLTRKGSLFSDYGIWISSGWFGTLFIGMQLVAASAAWFIGYDWLRSKRHKLAENTGKTSSEFSQL